MLEEKRVLVAEMISQTQRDLYDANFDPRVLEALDECKELCYDYNQIRPSRREERLAALREIVGSMGEYATVQSPFWCDYGKNIHVGENFYANHSLTILDGAPVTLSTTVFIANKRTFSTAGHPVDAARRNEGLEYALPITVGDDVWIGMGVSVCPGVTIGSNVVIGAGSVVVHDIPSNVVAVGVPCKPVKGISK